MRVGAGTGFALCTRRAIAGHSLERRRLLAKRSLTSSKRSDVEVVGREPSADSYQITPKELEAERSVTGHTEVGASVGA
jgi:hypothetical protein